MAFRGRYLSPAPDPEPPLTPCCAHVTLDAQSPPPCRNRVARNDTRTARNDARALGPGLERVVRGTHPEIAASEVEVCSGARNFAWRTVQFAVEVLDGRRPVAQLAAVADSGVVAAVRTLVGARLVPGRALGTAVLTRVDVVMVDSVHAEVCAAYDRGARHFALAARIARGRRGWRMTAFRVR